MKSKIFYPITAIKKWKRKRERIHDEEQYNNGYNFACGTMLRGKETPLSLTANYKSIPWNYRGCYGHWKHYDGWNYFDEGMDDAINYLSKKGLVKDNRIQEEEEN